MNSMDHSWETHEHMEQQVSPVHYLKLHRGLIRDRQKGNPFTNHPRGSTTSHESAGIRTCPNIVKPHKLFHVSYICTCVHVSMGRSVYCQIVTEALNPRPFTFYLGTSALSHLAIQRTRFEGLGFGGWGLGFRVYEEGR